MSLDALRKDNLIMEVNALVERISQQAFSPDESRKTLNMTRFALAYLQRHTPTALHAILDVPHATTTLQDYWYDFGTHVRPILERLATTYPEPEMHREALLYLLGWLYRVQRGWTGEHPRPNQTAHSTVSYHSRTEIPEKSINSTRKPHPVRTEEPAPKLEGLLNQASTPSAIATPTYRKGDKVQVRVLTGGLKGVVQLPDGSEIRGINLYGVEAEAMITVRIVEVTKEGKIKRLAR